MGQDRFKALKIVMQRAQINGCPVAANKTTLYKDAVSERKVFANEFQNKGDRKVTSVSVRILCFDEEVKLVGTIKNYEYNNLEVMPGETFGEAKYIACPSDSIQSFAVIVTNVEMEDDYYWSESTGKVMPHYREPEIVVEMAPEVFVDSIPDENNEPEKEKLELSESDMQIEVEESLFEGSAYPGSAQFHNINEMAQASAPVPSEKTDTSVPAPSEKTEANAPSSAEKSQTSAPVSTENKEGADSNASSVVATLEEIPDKKPKNKKLIRVIVTIAVAAVVIVLLVAAFFAFQKYKKYSDYNRGAAYMTSGNYDYAITVYSRLGDYMDSPKLLNEAKIAYAQSLANNGSYEEAINGFKELAGQEDKINATYDAWVSSLCSEGKYDEAMSIAKTEGVTVSEDILKMLNYEMGKIYSEHKEYNMAIECFTIAGKYENAATLLKEVYYNLAMEYVTVSNYDEALSLLAKSTGYKDTDKQIQKVTYLLGKRYLDTNNFEKALECFEKIKDYEDVSTLIPKCYYEKASALFASKEYKDAMEYYKLAGEYEDSVDKYNEALYEYLLTVIKEDVTKSTMELFNELPKNYKDSAQLIKTLNKYVDHVGTYKWTSSNDKEVNEKGGFEENIVVKLSYVNDEVIFTVDGHPVDLKKFAYDSGTSSDSYAMLNTTTITRTFNGKTHYYKKIVE